MDETISVSQEPAFQAHEQQLPAPRKLPKTGKNTRKTAPANAKQSRRRRNQKKELREWVNSFIQAAGAIAVVVSLVGLIINIRQFNQQQQAAENSARDQRNQATLDAYIDQMSTLLLQYHLTNTGQGDPTRAVAQARTYTALHDLDPLRRARLIGFLWGANLINGSQPIISVKLVNMVSVDFSNVYLDSVNLNRALLMNANFYNCTLTNADLDNAKLSRANLSLANLGGADLSGVDTDLTGANLAGANLSKANLTGVDLRKTNLAGADLSRANLTNANLRGTNLRGTILTGTILTGATMPDGSKHP